MFPALSGQGPTLRFLQFNFEISNSIACHEHFTFAVTCRIMLHADSVDCSSGNKGDRCRLFSVTQRDYYCVSNYYPPFCLTVRVVNVNLSVKKFGVMTGP
jgi:hypothetical protein